MSIQNDKPPVDLYDPLTRAPKTDNSFWLAAIKPKPVTVAGPHADSRIVSAGISALPTIFGYNARAETPAKPAEQPLAPAKGIEDIYPAAKAVGADRSQYVAPVSFIWR